MKKIIIIVIMLVLIGCFFAFMDYLRIIKDKEPIFSINVYTIGEAGQNGDHMGSDVYLGLGYKIYSYSNYHLTGIHYKMVPIFATYKNPNTTFPLIGTIIGEKDEYYVIKMSDHVYKLKKIEGNRFSIGKKIVAVCLGNSYNDLDDKEVIVPLSIEYMD